MRYRPRPKESRNCRISHNRLKTAKKSAKNSHAAPAFTITPEILRLIAEMEEFKGQWRMIHSLSPEKLTSLRRVATIESVGSSTRIEGSKLTGRSRNCWAA